MILLGITGTVGTGKSEICKFLKKKRIPIFDSDYEVKQLYKKKSVLNIIVLSSANTTKKYNFTINGIVINEKNDVNAVNDIDNATFPPNFLVI